MAEAGKVDPGSPNDGAVLAGDYEAPGELTRDAGDSDSHQQDYQAAEYLYRAMIAAPRRHASMYAMAGGLFAVVLGLAGFFAFSQTQLTFLRAAKHPFQLFLLIWTFAWPIVLTVRLVGASRLRVQWLIVLGYFTVLAGLGTWLVLTPTEASFQTPGVVLPAWSGESPMRLSGRWLLFNLAPTLLLLAFRRRRVRAVAPLVLSFMTVVSAGILGAIAAVYLYMDYAVTTMTIVLLTTVTCLLSGVLGWWLLVWIRNSYQHKATSDQSLAVDALWLIFTSFYAAVIAFAGPGWALVTLIAFLLFKIGTGVGNRYLHSSLDNSKEPALLILRVFALGKRSERLFEVVTKRWRYLGSVRLITGIDLAHATVAPHQFLAFLSRKLNRLFIKDNDGLDRSLAELDKSRDADSRFRIEDFFCHADTWKTVLLRLVKGTDVVLMDLRSFAQKHAGCIFEIRELLNTVAVAQIVFVVDATTDKRFLEQTVAEICLELRKDSPNFGIAANKLPLFELRSMGFSEVEQLMKQLCSAAARGK